MNKKEFVPLFENSVKTVQENGTLRYSQKILKNPHVQETGHIKVYEMGFLHEHTPEVTVLEENGQVTAIEFKCPCGSQATVKLVPEKLPQKEIAPQ